MLMQHEIIGEVVAPDWPSFVRKSALRADSFLARLSDTEFDQGMPALRAHGRRDLLLQNDAATHPPRRLPLDRRPAGRHQCLSRRAQRQPETLRVDSIRRRRSGQDRPSKCIIRLIECTSKDGALAITRRAGNRLHTLALTADTT
jgi:hypothetical protein